MDAPSKLEQVDITTLIPYARNARTHSDAQVAQIAASIREFGFNNPILIDADNGIIAGHGRVLAAHKLGLDKAPCLRLGHLTETQKRAYIIADNRLAELSGWDTELLALEIEDLRLEDFDIDLTGFSAEALEALFDDMESDDAGGNEGLTDPDDVPEPPAEPITKPGDVWLLGKHRLMCGDSTDAESVRRLMAGEKAGLMNTDPPYGIAYANDDRPNPGVAKPRVAKPRVAKPRVANDELCDEMLQKFLENAFRAATKEALKNNAAWYLWHAHLTQGYFAAAAAAAAADVILHRQIIWVKPVLLLGRGHYHWKHEPAFMGWVKGNQPPDYGAGAGERNQTTVWEVGQISQAERKEFNHSSPKPVALFELPIIKHLKAGEIAYEPFSGSGPQIIAAEKTGRRCYAMELSPQYVDVAVKRWQAFTGGRAVLESTGDPFPG